MVFFVKLISRGLAALTLPAALAVGRFFGWIFGSVVRHHRRDAFEALRKSFPEKSEEEICGIVNRMYANLGMSAVETLRLPYMDDKYFEEHMEWSGRDNARQALARGKGALALSAHLGNWEMMSILSPREMKTPASIIAKRIKGDSAQNYMDFTRGLFGLKILPAKNSYRKCIKALRRNELIGFVIDQNMIRREGEFVEFFGRPACTTLGLAHLSARTGAPVLPMIPIRKNVSDHEFRILPPLDPPASSEKKELVAATQEYTRIIEDAIRQYPDQWIWIHRRWKTPPEED